MKTEIFQSNSPDTVERAAAILRGGGLLAFPTETVYGLGASSAHPEAVEEIFRVKGRPQDNPLILHLSGPEQIPLCAVEVPEAAYALADRFWPGPLTIILKKRENVPDAVTAGLDTVGLRCPDNDVTRAVIAACGSPVAAPSANLSGRPSPTTAEHVRRDLEGKIPGILDGGPCSVGVESTIVDLTVAPPRLLRPGGVTPAELEKVLGPVDIDPAVLRTLNDDETPRAPGMKYRHYAPKAPLCVLRGDPERAAAYVARNGTQHTAVLCFDEERELFSPVCRSVFTYGNAADPATLARNLFRALRELDEEEHDCIYARCPQGDGVDLAVRNRLSKAAGHHFIDV